MRLTRAPIPAIFAAFAALAALGQTATRPVAKAREAAAQSAAPPAAAALAPAASTPAMAPALAPRASDIDAGTVVEGAMIYDHQGEDDPFYPSRPDCSSARFMREHPDKCSKDKPKMKGCGKYKLEQLNLTGITNTLGLPIAMLSAENKPYFVKVGDECSDAKVLEIDVKTTCVKWRQDLTPEEAANALRPYKDVFQCLRGLPPAAAGVR